MGHSPFSQHGGNPGSRQEKGECPLFLCPRLSQTLKRGPSGLRDRDSFS